MTYDIFSSPIHLLSCCHEKFVFAPIVKLECFENVVNSVPCRATDRLVQLFWDRRLVLDREHLGVWDNARRHLGVD